MAALSVDKLPDGPEWAYEVKLDGYRALLMKDGAQLQIRSRNDKDLTKIYPTLAIAGTHLHGHQAVVDGEIVALDENGRPSFQALQHRGRQHTGRIAFYAFDLLHLDGEDLTAEPWEQRRERLRPVVQDSGLLISEELPGSVAEIVAVVRSLGLEGVIAKRRASSYGAGERSGEWKKLKLDRQQEFVIGGYRPGSDGVDALLVGVYGDKCLRFAGKVRAGFVRHTRRDVARKLEPLVQGHCPFPELPDPKKSRWGSGVLADEMRIRGTSRSRGRKSSHWSGAITAEEMSRLVWVKPIVVVQVGFREWTEEGRLRHAAFIGLRNDKSARDVRRE